MTTQSQTNGGNEHPRREAGSGMAKAPEDQGTPIPRTQSVEMREQGRRIGYVVTIAANVVFLYIVHNVLGWRIPFITEAWTDVLWALDLSIAATIVGNALMLTYDRHWYRRLTSILVNCVSLLSAYVMWRVFPFDFGPTFWNDLAHLALAVAIFGVAVAIVVESVQLALGFNRD